MLCPSAHTLFIPAKPSGRSLRNVRGVVTLVNDITAPRQAEETQARLAAVVQTSDDAIVSRDLTGIIRTWNRGAERIFGWSEEEAVGKPIFLLIPPELPYRALRMHCWKTMGRNSTRTRKASFAKSNAAAPA